MNPLSGERIHFDVTAAETDGAYLEGRIEFAPHGAGPPEHVHPVLEERFRVVSGTLSARVAGSERTYGPGEEIVVPPGTPHRWWNDTGKPVELEFRVSPALPLDRFLEDVFTLAHRGLTDQHGLPSPLRMSRIIRRYWDVLYLAWPPLFIQKIVMGILSVVAAMLGYPNEYPYPYAAESGDGEGHSEAGREGTGGE